MNWRFRQPSLWVKGFRYYGLVRISFKLLCKYDTATSKKKTPLPNLQLEVMKRPATHLKHVKWNSLTTVHRPHHWMLMRAVSTKVDIYFVVPPPLCRLHQNLQKHQQTRAEILVEKTSLGQRYKLSTNYYYSCIYLKRQWYCVFFFPPELQRGGPFAMITNLVKAIKAMVIHFSVDFRFETVPGNIFGA